MAPVKQVIVVGTKAKVGSDAVSWTEPIPFEVETRENPDLKPGEVKAVQEGVPGLRTNTIPITVDENGNPVMGEKTSEVTTEPVNKIIEVGPGVDDEIKEERNEIIPFETIVKYDPTLSKGQHRIEEGENGSKTVTTTIKIVDGKAQDPVVTEEITKEPKQRIIWVGELDDAQPQEETVETEYEIPFEVVYRLNPELTPGTSQFVSDGVPGKGKTITTVKFDPVTGEVTQESADEVTQQPVNAVVEFNPNEDGKAVFEEEFPLPFDVEVVEDPDLEAGTVVTDQEGVLGSRVVTTTNYCC